DTSGSSNGGDNLAILAVAGTGTIAYVAKAANATACSQVAGSAFGCEFMVYDLSSTTNPLYIRGIDASLRADGDHSISTQAILVGTSTVMLGRVGVGVVCEQLWDLHAGCEIVSLAMGSTLSGTMTGTSRWNNMTASGVTFVTNAASTTNLTIATTSIFVAPASDLDISGNFTQQGEWHSNQGTVLLSGTNQLLSAAATTTFYNLSQVATTTATTTFRNGVTWQVANNLLLSGSSNNRLKLRSLSEGAQLTLLPTGSSTTRYLDVKDTRNSSSTYLDCSIGCIDRGNNVNWTFTPVVFGSGSSTLTSHGAGQIGDAFNAQSASNESLLGFSLTPQTGDATVTSVQFDLIGVKQVTSDLFTNVRLVIDRNSNQQFDGSDTLVGGAGELLIESAAGYIIFSESFAATSSLNYLIIADWTTPNIGSFMTIQLSPHNIRVSDAGGYHTMFGSVISRQHSRNNLGGNSEGSGNGGSVGEVAPSGAGDVGGGSSIGGEVVGDNPDYVWPSSESGAWASGASAHDRTDGTYATTNATANHHYTDHGFVVPASNTIQGIVIKLEVSGTTGAGSVDVQLSWDGGASWTSTKSTPTVGLTDVVYTLGSPSDTWGRSWSVGEFSNANFAVRVIGNPSSNTVRLDAIQARVYHISGGGGGGGGGAI
ncbi:MAG: hypothetical protein RLZZ360_486, partial [Candidatus Parcubacteria bacterium]